MKFGEFIRDKRKAIKLSREALAEAADMAAKYLADIECERVPPPRTPIVKRLASALHIDENELETMAKAERQPRRVKPKRQRQEQPA